MHEVNKPNTLNTANSLKTPLAVWALLLVYLVNVAINAASVLTGDVLGFIYCFLSLVIVFGVMKQSSTALVLLKLKTVILLAFALIVLMAMAVVELADIDMKISSGFYLKSLPLSLQIVLFYAYAGLQGYVAFSKRTKGYVEAV